MRKITFIAGKRSHGYGGILSDTDTIVVFADGGRGHYHWNWGNDDDRSALRIV